MAEETAEKLPAGKWLAKIADSVYDDALEAKARAERRIKSLDAHVNMQRAELALRKSLVRINLAEQKK